MAIISGSRVFSAAVKNLTEFEFNLTFDRNDQLRDHGQHLRSTLLKHIEHALHGQESVWVLLFTDAFKEDGQVVVVVQLRGVNLPVNFVLRTMLNCNWKVSAVVETAELTGSNRSTSDSACLWLLDLWCRFWFVRAKRLAAFAFTLL